MLARAGGRWYVVGCCRRQASGSPPAPAVAARPEPGDPGGTQLFAMKLADDIHLAYCTNVHRGDTWEETFDGLQRHTLRLRREVCPADQPYAIGLRLSARAADELARPATLDAFRRWLDEHQCYVFTINGFPYGSFHGTRVKEQVFQPDWSTPERLDYTCLLFDLLARLLPDGMEGSVSSLPGSFKEFALDGGKLERIFDHLKRCQEHISRLAENTGHDLHLGLEPEPLGLFETSGETLKFFGLLVERHPNEPELLKRIGINYDTCHLALQFEQARDALERLTGAGLRLSKLHLSSALTLAPTDDALARLGAFEEEVYLHQVIVGDGDEPLRRFRDVPDALRFYSQPGVSRGRQWRVHFHIPLHAAPGAPFGDTRDHITDTLDWLADHRQACRHLEMETYTWEVLPEHLRSDDVVEQLRKEYDWCLAALSARALV